LLAGEDGSLAEVRFIASLSPASSAARPRRWSRISCTPWHSEIAREMVDIHDRLVTTLAALNRERPHAVLAHRLDRIGEAGGGHLA